MLRVSGAFAMVVLLAGPVLGQTPQPFPRPGGASPPATARPPAEAARPPAPQVPAAQPDQATLAFPVYPAAQFLASYDARQGQRFYLFGTTAAYNDIVAYYRTQLGTRGSQVFREPPTHMFEVGRFREESMAFPPGVTVKDWTWGSLGYPNPELGAEPSHFPTIIMIVPPPAGQ